MDDIQLFTNNLLQKEREKVAEDLKAFKVQEAVRLQQQQTIITEQQNRDIERIDAQLQQQQAIEKERIANNKRNAVLLHKQTVLNQLFDEAYKQMTQMSQDKFEAFVRQAVEQLDSQREYTITFGTLSQPVSDLPSHVRINDERIDGAGFTIHQGGLVYNYLFNNLLADVKNDLMGEFASRI